jgi:hypothetical protein
MLATLLLYRSRSERNVAAAGTLQDLNVAISRVEDFGSLGLYSCLDDRQSQFTGWNLQRLDTLGSKHEHLIYVPMRVQQVLP